jgi:hypothetical protein
MHHTAPVWMILSIALLCCGCASRAPMRQGGRASAMGAELVAPQNPSAPSQQIIIRTQLSVTVFPPTAAPAEVRDLAAAQTGGSGAVGASPAAPTHIGQTIASSVPPSTGKIILSASRVPVAQTTSTPYPPSSNLWMSVEQVTQTIGPAYQDTSAAIHARAAALRPVQWLGLGLVILALAAAGMPGLRAFIGSGTTIAGLWIAGIGMALAPAIVPGHERILAIAALCALAIYWWAHRHGELRGLIRSHGTRQSSNPS